MSERVRTAVNGHVFEVTLDNPKANAIGAEVSREMNEAFKRFRDDPDLRVAILTGAGDRFFCTGWDLNDGAQDEPDRDFGPCGFGGVAGMFDLNKPVIMAINGYCVAGGFELALSGDLMVASENAEFFLSEVNMGLTTSGASISRLCSRLPRHIAMELLFTGRRMKAQEAFDLKLLNRVTPQGQVMDAAREIAKQIASAAPLSVQAEKQMVSLCGDLSPAEADKLENAGRLTAKARVYESEDSREGARAFIEKRKPVWTGR
ncbi:MAG: enoyl-CoA hydratase/isomerase family protein [Rhodospirillales bacterium]|nr:enoyl-CoA hydratase/isomerase family protein [Rhodospirillales bacterium]